MKDFCGGKKTTEKTYKNCEYLSTAMHEINHGIKSASTFPYINYPTKPNSLKDAREKSIKSLK